MSTVTIVFGQRRCELVDEAQRRGGEVAAPARRTISSGTSIAVLGPPLLDPLRFGAVGDHRHREQVIGRDRPRVRERFEQARR